MSSKSTKRPTNVIDKQSVQYLMSSRKISTGDNKTLSELYEVVNVAPDGNCWFYVAMNYVNKYKGRKFQCVDRFRKDLKKHMKDNKTRLTSKNLDYIHYGRVVGLMK